MQKFGFHESTVVALSSIAHKFEIELEDVSYGEKRVKVKIEVEGVTKLRVDSKLLDAVTMPMPDGEVLSLKYDDSSLDVLVEWNDFSTGHSVTHSYDILGDKVEANVIL